MIDPAIGRDLLELINAGDEYEMPRGVARRMVAAGWQHPAGNDEQAFTDVLTSVMLMGSDDVNAAGAAALAASGVHRGTRGGNIAANDYGITPG